MKRLHTRLLGFNNKICEPDSVWYIGRKCAYEDIDKLDDDAWHKPDNNGNNGIWMAVKPCIGVVLHEPCLEPMGGITERET